MIQDFDNLQGYETFSSNLRSAAHTQISKLNSVGSPTRSRRLKQRGGG